MIKDIFLSKVLKLAATFYMNLSYKFKSIILTHKKILLI